MNAKFAVRAQIEVGGGGDATEIKFGWFTKTIASAIKFQLLSW